MDKETAAFLLMLLQETAECEVDAAIEEFNTHLRSLLHCFLSQEWMLDDSCAINGDIASVV